MADVSGVTREILDAVMPMAAGWIEKRPSAAELVSALQDSGVFRMLQPTRYGGRAVAAGEFISVTSALAALDGSAGWLSAMSNGAAYDIAGLSDEAADETWNTDTRSLVAACYQPEGRLVRTGNDRRLTGRWHSVAGGGLADWLLLTADQDGARYRVLVPRRKAHVEPIQAQNGLPAAALCDVTVSDVPVPEQRTFRAELGAIGRPPTPVVVGAGAAAVVAGSADGVWRAHVDQVRARLAASYGNEEVTDRTSTAQVARAASDIDAAKLQIAASIQPSGPSDPSDQGTDVLRAAGWAQRQAVVRARDAADRLLGSSRRHALDASDPVTRLWQDVHAACRLTTRLLDGLDLG